jgi:hypothetical protein
VKTPQLPNRFVSWDDYGDEYNVDFLGSELLCRKCGEVWALRHYRGKLLQRAHVCPSGCNGTPRARSAPGYAPAVVVNRQRALWEEKSGWRGEDYPGPDRSADDYPSDTEERMRLGRERRAKAALWLHLREHADKWAALDDLWDEAAAASDPSDYVAKECARLRRVDRA